MKSIILYSTLKRSRHTSEYEVIEVLGHRVFIRGELHEGDVLEALDVAAPRPGETVLNSIPAE